MRWIISGNPGKALLIGLYIFLCYRIAVFSIEVLKDERIVIIAEQRPDCPEEEVNIMLSHVVLGVSLVKIMNSDLIETC